MITLASVNQISAEEIMDKEPLKVQNDRSLASIKNRMEDEDIRAIPVVDSKGNLEGVISYRDLIRFIQFNPARTKLDKVMHNPPEFEAGDTLVDLCELRVNSGRKLMVNLNGKKLAGVIGDKELVEAFTDAEELDQVSTRDIESYDLITAYEDDTIEEVRHTMLDQNISRVPIVNKDGQLTGIVNSTDILRTMVPRESPPAGGTSGERTGGEELDLYGGGEKESLSDVTVDQIMDRLVTVSENTISAREAAKTMVEESEDKNRHEIVFVDGQYPESIVTLKDIVDFVAELAPGRTILVNISGLNEPEERAAVHNKIKTQVQGSLGRKLDRPEEIRAVYDIAEKDGRKHRYELDLRLSSEYGLIKVAEEGWDMLDVMDRALEELNKIVRKKKDKRTEH